MFNFVHLSRSSEENALYVKYSFIQDTSVRHWYGTDFEEYNFVVNWSWLFCFVCDSHCYIAHRSSQLLKRTNLQKLELYGLLVRDGTTG